MQQFRKIVLSGMLGNALEWYDYALYAQMAFIISELFFPHSAGNENVALLATFGVFAAGFLFRPLGALLFGIIGDRYGRKMSLVIAILMMAIPTGCIGLLPTYETAGILAPLLLTLIRIFQGLSLGGEFSGSIVYIVEHAPPQHRALAGATSVISLLVGFLMGSFVALATVNFIPPDQFRVWGWRVPFLLGIGIGLVGLYIRTACDESPIYEEAKRNGSLEKNPLKVLFQGHKMAMLQAFGLYVSVTMPFYLVSVFLLSYTQKSLGFSVEDALWMNTGAMFSMMLMTFFVALLADKIGRKPILVAAVSLMAISAVPLFLLMHAGTFLTVFLAQIGFSLLVAGVISPAPTVLVEIFPTSVRYTGMAISYNAAAAIFGGTSPMVCQWLLNTTKTDLSIALYVIACNLFSLCVLCTYRDTMRKNL